MPLHFMHAYGSPSPRPSPPRRGRGRNAANLPRCQSTNLFGNDGGSDSLSPSEGERCSLCWKVFFHGSYSQLGGSGVEQWSHPRTVVSEALFVDVGVVAGAVLPEPPQDFEPAFTQAAQRGGVAEASLAFVRVVRPGPRTLLAAVVDPQMHGVAQHLVAGPADARFVHL